MTDTTTDALVERLRQYETLRSDDGAVLIYSRLVKEAADTIAAQAARIEALEAARLGVFLRDHNGGE